MSGALIIGEQGVVSIEHTASVEEVKVILFRLDGQILGLRIAHVREVMKYQSPTPVPDSPGWVVGVLNVSGRILPVASLSSCLYGRPHNDKNTSHLLNIEVDGQEVALTADEVTAIRTFSSDLITDPAGLASGMCSALLEGIIRPQSEDEGEVILMIDPEKVADFDLMKEVVEQQVV